MQKLTFKDKRSLFFNGCMAKVTVIAWLLIAWIFWSVIESKDIDDLRLIFGSKSSTNGYVTYKEYTNLIVDDEEIFQFYFTFPIGEEIISGESFGPDYYNIDDQVKITYLASDPIISTIVDQDNTKGGLAFTIFFSIVFGIVSFFLFRRIRRATRDIQLVERGELTDAERVDVSETNVEINNQRQMKITYEFDVSGKTYTHLEKTTKPGNFSANEKIVYLSEKPNVSVLLSTLPTKIRQMMR